MEENQNDKRTQDLVETETVERKEAPNKTSTGLDENIAALLSYVLGFVTGIIFIILEKDNRFVRFHALQSIFTFGALFVLNFVLSIIPIIGWLIGILLVPVALILWIVLMVKAYQGEYFKLPVVGNLVEDQLNK